MMSNQQNSMLEAVNQLRYFLSSAHLNWAVNQTLKRFQLPNGETISCVYWKNTFYITGTDILSDPSFFVSKLTAGPLRTLRNSKKVFFPI